MIPPPPIRESAHTPLSRQRQRGPHQLTTLTANWQKLAPVLAVIGAGLWLVFFRAAPASEQAMFAALLVLYLAHQVEEHLWPGGFRQFTNAHIFRSGNENWPVSIGGVTLVNVGFVWLPLALAVIFPGPSAGSGSPGSG